MVSRDGLVLREWCQTFSSSRSLDELGTSIIPWVGSAMGCHPALVGFTLPDPAGRLRVVWKGGAGADGSRKRSEGRRTAFRTQRSIRTDVGDGRSLALFPLISRGASFGLLEVTAPREAIEQGWEVLEVIANQAAITLNNLSEQRRLRRQVETLQGVATLGRDLVGASDPQAAVRLAARFMAERLELPVAAWVASPNSGWIVLTAVAGLGSRKRKELHDKMEVVPRSVLSRSPEREALVRRFGDALGAHDIATVEAGDALLLVAHAPDSLQPTCDAVGSLLGGILPYIAMAAMTEQRNRQLDMGIAWTAHELRAPLIAVKAVLECLLTDADNPSGSAMLRRSLVELEELVQTTDGLLRWAVGQRPLRRRVADVVKVVSDAIRSCNLGWENRMTISGPLRAMARIDPGPLRRAIENVLRNALAYSDPDSIVAVSVKEEADVITVSVRDIGPSVPASESEGIFDPFVRGTVWRSRSGNVGLGLFIARRVMEAHGGRIWVDSDRGGTTFHLQVPRGLARARNSAS
jgi:signal transduction histidine kinase